MADTPALKKIGRYDIERVLGEGAMGVVYEANDARLHRKVAIKTILKSALDSDSAREYSMRFAREAQAVARLNHPNIVQVFDFAEEGDMAYIVMELVRGRELKSFFEAKEKFAAKEIVHIMGELCEALHFAHDAGIVHRDIKPANVMIDTQGRVKLTDFGVARVTDPDRTVSEKTQAGAVVGTPAYMSPEQIEGQALDRRTDIFSAGVILYEFLAGEKPFTGAGVWTIAKKILSEHPPSPSSRNPGVSPMFDPVVAKALAKSAAERYQTARELGVDLKRALEGLPPAAEVDGTVKLEVDPEVAALFSGAPAPQPAGDPTVLRTVPMAAASTVVAAKGGTEAVELEYWRSIKDGNDPNDFDLYVQQFPSGIYTALAKRKSAKLRGVAAEESGAKTPQQLEQERHEIEEAARREAEAKARLDQEKAEMEARLAQREAEFQKREAELKKREAEVPKKASPLVPALATLAVAAVVGVAAWQYFKPTEDLELKVAELTRQLEESRKREAELQASRERYAQLEQSLAEARQKAEEALRTGDLARQRELVEQVRQREAEVRKQAELTRQREIEARRQAEAVARLQAESGGAKGAAVARVEEPARPAAPAKAEPVRPPERPLETARPSEAVKTEPAEPVKVATASPPAAASPSAAPAAPDAGASLEALLQRAIALESEGRNAEAVKVLRQVARGSQKGPAVGQAAKRLGDLYNKGGGGVTRDYAEALRYYDMARANGVEVQTAKAR